MAIRRSDGTVWNRGVWTNSFPYYILNPLFLGENNDCVNSYCKAWGAIKGESEWWGSYPDLAPNGYGIIVIDFVKKKILSMQNYSKIDTIYSAGIELSIPSVWRRKNNNPENYTPIKWSELKKDLDEDKEFNQDPYYMTKIETFIYYAIRDKIHYDDFYTIVNKDFFGILPEPKGFKTEEEAFDWFMENYSIGYANRHDSEDKRPSVNFSIDLSPFEVIEFPETLKGTEDFRQAMIDLGFQLSQQDETAWKNYIEEEFNSNDSDDD